MSDNENIDLPIGDEELERLEEIVDGALEDEEVEVGVDLDKNGKSDLLVSVKGKAALVVAVILGVVIVTKLSGLW